ncbi:MAG: 3-(cis-5,6-dihydroxycyclohexa-1,3-dien-1-yl)propanoate dehydrogenase [Acetobacteraceae bacterium]|jgi:cis-2,3-dihydrobiphenyl-2,3-diol dehydrogenase
MGSLDGQVALVTGGGSGIGRAVVARFVEEGARVGIMERAADRTGALRSQFGAAVVAIHGDAGNLADNKRAVAETVSAFGQLDVFVGNAGIFDVYAKLADLGDEELTRAYEELFGVNVRGCVFGARAAVAELRKTGGSMIFTASVAGLNSGGGGALYTASKHAVVGLIRALAVELSPDIRVNGVAPGGTMTDLRGLVALGNDDRSQFANPAIENRLRAGNPLRMVLQPDDLAGAYAFLASRRDAKGITGSILTVDAGGLLRVPRAN